MVKTTASRLKAQTPMPTTVNYGTIINNNINNHITNYFQRREPVEAATEAAEATTTEVPTATTATTTTPKSEGKKRQQTTTNDEEKGERKPKNDDVSETNGMKPMTSFFARAEVPAQVEGDGPRVEEHILPKELRQKFEMKKTQRGIRKPYYHWLVSRNGTVRGSCKNNNCPHGLRAMHEFEPRDCNNNARKRVQFQNAMKKFAEACLRRDGKEAAEVIKVIGTTRSTKCTRCRNDLGYLSPRAKECKEYYDNLRKRKCLEQGGCFNPQCPMRDPNLFMVLHGNHTHGSMEEDESKRKTYHLSDYSWWSCHGGVEAMKAEVAKGMTFICSCCHALDPLTPMANRYEDPDTMPDGKRRGTDEEQSLYERKRVAKIVYPKQKYVDKFKLQMGCCANCERKVEEGKEVMFDCNHIDESTKLIGEDTLAGDNPGGVAGIVNNHHKDAALDAPGVEEALEHETYGKCNVLCKNCHHLHTNYKHMPELMELMKTTQQRQ